MLEGLGAGWSLILEQRRAGGDKRLECQVPQAKGLRNSRDRHKDAAEVWEVVVEGGGRGGDQ